MTLFRARSRRRLMLATPVVLAAVLGGGHFMVDGAMRSLASATSSVASIAAAGVGNSDLGPLASRLPLTSARSSAPAAAQADVPTASAVRAVRAVRALVPAAQIQRACTDMAGDAQQRAELTRAVRAQLTAEQASRSDAQLDLLIDQAARSLCPGGASDR